MCKRNGAGTNETPGTIFGYENLKGHHVIKYGSPFKNKSLKTGVEPKVENGFLKLDPLVVSKSFLNICAPDPSDIWNYAHRISNISRKQDLIDLPESLTITLTDFALDTLDLGHYDLQGDRLDALRNSRDSFWLSLGQSDEERDKKFNILLEKKSYWSSQIGICISEALQAFLRF
ncbi:unnamed protein product [Cylicocyclus nassatus]|uniref:Uncharacterized protein n=1 Tax=Cylicocyclus nassatus TaxID=53992 RepID=A0AA36H302_CYLNA|nr:unnamed protein product [Cylicocyclus nassatus]